MFFKTVKTPKKSNNPYRWSIASRLTLIYSLSAFLMLVMVVSFLYWALTTSLQKEMYHFLRYKSRFLANELYDENDNDTLTLKEEVFLEPALYHYYVRILGMSGETLIETPDMSSHIPTEIFKQFFSNNKMGFPVKVWHSPKENRSYILMNTFVEKKHPESQHQIQIAKDISAQNTILADYKKAIITILLAGIILSSLIGIIITRQGLKSLREMTRSAKRITIAQLNERLDPLSWPKELADLAMEFNHMLDRIEEGFNRLNQFSGDLAHELRTPINNLMNAAELALSQPKSISQYQEILGFIFEEFERISQLIESLLFLARSENPQVALKYVTIEMKKVLEDICDFYEGVAAEKNIYLHIAGDSVIVKADLAMLKRSLGNLVSNALQHTPEGGKITLTSQLDVHRNALISVADTGSGISAEHLPYLFNRFYRVDSARSQQAGGAGLGLAIVKFIMDLHNGQVSITSTVGEGTIITLAFPP